MNFVIGGGTALFCFVGDLFERVGMNEFVLQRKDAFFIIGNYSGELQDDRNMTWQNIIGHDEAALAFARANQRGRLGGSFLFVGPRGIGKQTFAFALAKTLLCEHQFHRCGESHDFESLDDLKYFVPCGKCASCLQFYSMAESGDPTKTNNEGLSSKLVINHPDFFYVCKPPDRTQFPLDLLIGEKENRMHSGLCFDISKTPVLGGRKIAVIDDADYFNDEGANALLKTLEEPPENTLLILIGTSAAIQLPTIRSRCQTIRFKPLESRAAADIMVKNELTASFDEALRLTREANGSLARALEFADEELDHFRGVFFNELAQNPFDTVDLTKQLNEFVDAAGKESKLRRDRLRLVLLLTLDFYRSLLEFSLMNGKCQVSMAQQSIFEKALRSRERSDPQVIIRCAEKTLDAMSQIDRNVNVPYIVDSWLESLSQSVFCD